MARVAADGAADIPLLKDEAGGLMMQEGIATITFYKEDFKAATERALRVQLAQVVASNPWLAGRLVSSKTGTHLRHPASPSAADVDALFPPTAADDRAAFKLAPASPYAKICDDVYKHKVVVGSGSSLLGTDKPVANLTVAESGPGAFALIFSMSHAVGDGRTYYEILKMLSPGSAVRALSATRVQFFSESMRDACGREELEWSDKSATACGYTCGMLLNKPVKCFAFYLDPEKVAAAKAAGVTAGAAAGVEVPYLTTNDVLTSGFFNECGAGIGMMGMDCRGKLEGIGADLAGNYVTALVMDRGTFSTPAAVRKMLSSTPYQTVTGPLPGCCALACGGNSKFAQATNWSTFAGGLVQLEGCELAIHLPVVNTAYITFDQIIPFSSGAGKVGVIVWTVSTDEEGLPQALPVGECVSKELFP